jgi:hypothetical protein
MIVWGVVKIASFAGGNASQQPLREHDIEIELRPVPRNGARVQV